MSNKATTLYKLDKKGKVIFWTIEHDSSSYWTTTGLYPDGKKTTTLPTYCKGKNKGRANETTDAEQTELEVASKIKKQKDGGYTETIPTERRFDVSLAAKYVERKEKGKLDFPYIYQPKLDGLRCYIIKGEDGELHAYSRNHKEYISVPHILKDELVVELFNRWGDLVLDGELYNHELKSDFNKIVSIVRKTKPSLEDLMESAELIRFNCFDCYFQNHPEWKYMERNDLLIGWAAQSRVEDSSLVFVSSGGIGDARGSMNGFVANEGDVEAKIREYIANGFEGIMLKKDVPYFFGRSSDLLKYKFFKDEEFKLVDIEEGKGNLKGVASIAWLEDKRGVKFKAGVTGTQEYARDLLKNKDKYIGKMATVKYQDLTPEGEDGKGGVPRFGKMTAIRDYE